MLNRFYGSGKEENRLCTSRMHRLEKITVDVYLEKVLKPGMSVLDACAGGGAYCFGLARVGMKVTAGDIVTRHVALLKSHPDAALLEDAIELDCCDLSRFADASFDAVLCMGALYNLQEDAAREKAFAECVRIIKPKGLLAFTYLCRYGCMMKNLNEHPDQIERIVEQYESRRKRCFYRMVPEEAQHLAQCHGLEQIYHVSCQGASALILPSLERLSEDDFEKYCEMHLASCEESSLIGAGVHGLFIGRKLK